MEKFTQETKRKMDKLRKWLKRRDEVSESPASKTRRLVQNVPDPAEMRRSLLVYYTLKANIKDTLSTTKKKTHRQVMSQVVNGRILRKYGL